MSDDYDHTQSDAKVECVIALEVVVKDLRDSLEDLGLHGLADWYEHTCRLRGLLEAVRQPCAAVGDDWCRVSQVWFDGVRHALDVCEGRDWTQ